MAGTLGAKKKAAGAPDGATAATKRIKRNEPAITPEEVANFLPKPAVEYVKESKVSTYHLQLPNSY
jgi:hypothetical protein